MNDYKITYVIETLETEHTRFLSADSEQQARDLFTESADRSLLGQNKVKIINISLVPVQDDLCYGTCDCC